MADLYAVCRPNGNLEIKSVQINNQVQIDIGPLFQAQELAFFANVQAEIPFTGDWKPDEDELLVLAGLPEVQILLAAATQNAVALQPLNVQGFENERVVGLFIATGNGNTRKLLLQNFSAQQILQTRYAVMFDGNVFRRLTEPSFSIATHLTAVITAAGDIKFKSYAALRRTLDISSAFRNATDAEIVTFCAHASLAVANAQSFAASADEGIRKHIHAITATGVLNQHTVPDITARAAAIGFALTINAGLIEVPTDRRSAKELFSFLLNKVYRGPLNQQLFITNSNRPL